MTENGEDTFAERTVVARLVASAPPPRIGHYIVYSDGETVLRQEIGAAGLTIGRTAPSDFTINNANISRRHCRVELAGDWALVSDLGSTNGTFIDGMRIERPTRLNHGAQISLGAVPLKYERRDLKELEQEQELSADLKRAEDYVRAILPQPLTSGPVLANWCFIPSTKLGGDAFGYQFLEDEYFTGFLLDVSGHGIGSSMHAANVANTLRRRALPEVDFLEPAKVAAGLNQVFPMEEHNGLMFTIWYFCYHVPMRKLRFCAAGHHAAELMVPGETSPRPLWARSPAIGMLPFGKWHEGEAEIPPGSRLYLFSDGAFEIVSAQGAQWSAENLREIITAVAEPEEDEPGRLFKAVRAAARPGPLDDDFSVVHFTFV